jgi:hypothetical protein
MSNNPHINNKMRIKIKKLLTNNPNITTDDIEQKLGASFTTIQKRTVRNIKWYFLHNYKQHPLNKKIPFSVKRNSNLSLKLRNEIAQLLISEPELTPKQIIEKIGIKPTVKKIKTIANLKHRLKNPSPDETSDKIIKVNRKYVRKPVPTTLISFGLISGKDLSEKAITVFQNIPGVNIMPVAGRHKQYEIRLLLPSGSNH